MCACVCVCDTQAAASKVHDFRAYELRWLLDPLQLLPAYQPPEEAGRIIRNALAAKEAAPRVAGRARSPADDEARGGGSADVCHESIAMGLNDMVSDMWLTNAVMVAT